MGGVLPYIGYAGMCRWKGYGFQAIWSGIGSSNYRKLVYYRIPFNGIAHKRLKSRTTEHFLVWYRVTEFAKFGLVKGRTFANPVAHPHPNYMGVRPVYRRGGGGARFLKQLGASTGLLACK